MKALTVQQPWGWAIFHGKNIENRTQCWTYRGPLAIHAGARWSDRGAISPLVRNAWLDAAEHNWPPDTIVGGRLPMGYFTYGCILGTVELVDVHPDAGCCRSWGESAYVEHGARTRRQVPHLVLENPRLLAEPIPCRGALGLWTPPSDITEQLEGPHR